MSRAEPIYLKFIRRSQERKKERELEIKNKVNEELKKSIGYKILIRMGWKEDEGLGKERKGKTTIEGMIAQGRKTKGKRIKQHFGGMEEIDREYREIIGSVQRNKSSR